MNREMETMEEGELASSSSETEFEGAPNLGEFDYSELPRPARPVTQITADAQPASLPYSESDEDVLGFTTTCSEDSSDEIYTVSKVRRTQKQMFPRERRQQAAAPMEQAPAAYNNYAQSFQKRRVNNIWANVVEEERIASTTEGLGNIGVEEPKDVFQFNRGPESFAIDRSVATKRRFSDIHYIHHDDRSRSSASGSGSCDYASDYSTPDVHLSSEDTASEISSGGLSDSSNNYIRSSIRAKKSSLQKTESAMRMTGSHNEKNKQKLASLSDSQLARYIHYGLKERDNMAILQSAIKLLGRDTVVHLYFKSLAIEKVGGLLIKNGSRRRTTGGIFFYMMRTHPLCDPKLVQQVFQSTKIPTANRARPIKKPVRRSDYVWTKKSAADTSSSQAGASTSGQVELLTQPSSSAVSAPVPQYFPPAQTHENLWTYDSSATMPSSQPEYGYSTSPQIDRKLWTNGSSVAVTASESDCGYSTSPQTGRKLWSSTSNLVSDLDYGYSTSPQSGRRLWSASASQPEYGYSTSPQMDGRFGSSPMATVSKPKQEYFTSPQAERKVWSSTSASTSRPRQEYFTSPKTERKFWTNDSQTRRTSFQRGYSTSPQSERKSWTNSYSTTGVSSSQPEYSTTSLTESNLDTNSSLTGLSSSQPEPTSWADLKTDPKI